LPATSAAPCPQPPDGGCHLGHRSILRFLTDGRLFIRRDDGAVIEADAFERSDVTFLLSLQERGALNPTLGLELLPPAES
jgi:hypothetical protein